MADVHSAPAPAAGTSLIEPGEVFDSHAPTAAAGVIEPGVSHRSSLGPIMHPIEAISAVLLIALIGLVLVAVFWRYLLGSPITASDEIASFIFLWLVMLGSVIAIDRNEHLRLALLLNKVGPRTRSLLEAVGMVIMATFLGALLPSAIEHTIRGAVRHLAGARNPECLAGRGHPARDGADAGCARREAVAGDEPQGPAHQHRDRGRRGRGAMADDADLRPARHGQHPRAAGRRDRRLPYDRRADRLLLRRRRPRLPALLDATAYSR